MNKQIFVSYVVRIIYSSSRYYIVCFNNLLWFDRIIEYAMNVVIATEIYMEGTMQDGYCDQNCP